MAKRPRIGITGPDSGGIAAWIFTALSVLMAGGRPVHIKPSRPSDITGLKGLIIGGGADIDPEAYEKADFIKHYLDKTLRNKQKSLWQRIFTFFRRLSYPLIFLFRRIFSVKASGKIDKRRDELEFNLLDKAIKRQLPVLGICRGSQLINIYFKGNLYQEIMEHYEEHVNRYSIFPIKEVYVQPGSLLAEILQVTHLWVNSLHHQSVNEPGTGIRIVATEPSGVVQAIESTTYKFVLGVQWHPEYLLEKRKQRRIFKALVEHATKIE